MVTVFMAGLGLGTYIVYKILQRYPYPLKVFAVLEIGIGLWALSVPLLLKGVDHLHILLSPTFGHSLFFESLLHLGLSALVLLIPTIMMGGTLPALTTCCTDRLQQLGSKLSILYAVNTFGAVAGTWWVGFYALPWLGINLTNIIVVLTNLAIGILLLLTEMFSEYPNTKSISLELTTENKTTYFLIIGMGISGFSAMIYEIAWTRMLIMVLGSSTYAFSCILMAFLLGIALGSFIYNLLLRKYNFDLFAFCMVEVLIGFFCLLSLPAFNLLPRAYLILYHMLPSGTWGIQGLRFLIPIAIMIVPTTLMGFAFPLAAELYSQAMEEVTKCVCKIHGFNALGNVFGAFFTGFFFLSILGAQNTLKLAIILNLCIGIVGFLLRISWRSLVLAGITVLLGGLTVLHPPWDKYLISSGVGVYAGNIDPLQSPETRMYKYEMLYHKEGLNTVAAIYQTPDGFRFMMIDGKTDASNNVKDMPTQLLTGYVPLFSHPDTQDVLSIGMGSGTTTGAIAQYDFIRRVDCVEIEPAVVEAAKFFNRENHNLHQNPKVNIIVDDARNYLKQTDHSYDLIISSPSNPWMKGVANLFTTEFYRLSRNHLKANGIMCQWIHLYKLSPEVLKMVINTFRQSFPYCQLWFIPQGNDALMLGSRQPFTFDLERVAQLINYNPDIKKEMERVLVIDSPSTFFSYFLLDNEELTEFTKGADLNTDNHPLLEFSAPYDLLSDKSNLQLNYEIIKNYKHSALPANLKLNKNSLANYHYAMAGIYLRMNKKQEAFRHINEAIKYNDQDPRFFLVRGQVHSSNKNLMSAKSDFEHSLILEPKNYKPYMEIASLFVAQKIWDEAQHYYQKSLELSPDNHNLLFRYSIFLFFQGKPEQALSIALKLTSSSDLTPFKIWEFIGDIYGRLGNFNKAKTAYEKSYNHNTSNYMIMIKRGEVDLVQGNVEEALKKFNTSRHILELYRSKDVRLFFLIADCHIRLKQNDKAAQVLREILKKDPGNQEASRKLASLKKQ